MTTIPLQRLVPAPAAGFEAPFEMLEACHERVHRMLALLARLRGHVARHGVDAQARLAATDVMRYFDRAAPEHHRDEELHVFPPLLAEGDEATRALVHRLQQDHRAMEEGWARARAVLAAIEADAIERLSAEDDAQLGAFEALYAGHIEAEEAVAYPAARKVLDEGALGRMSLDMMRRRGVV